MKQIFSVILIMWMAGIGLMGQTLDPPNLKCTSTQVNGFVELTWDNPTITCGAFVSYDIYYSIGSRNGPYSLLTSITAQGTTTYLDNSVNGNNDTIYYYMVNNYNCPGYTAVHSDTLDNLDPFAPLFTRVSVSGNNVELFWSSSTSPEATAYIIFHYDGGFQPIDTVYGTNIFYYLDQNASPGTKSEQYTIAAMDECGNAGPFSTFPHRTVHLDYDLQDCSRDIELEWNTYINWPGDSVLEYRIKYSLNGDPYKVDKSVDGNTTSAKFASFNDGDSVCIIVEAVHPNGSIVSASNEICVTALITQPVDFNYIFNATVTKQDEITVAWLVDTNAALQSIKILKGTDSTSMNTVANIKTDSLNSYMEFKDKTVIEEPYYYRIIVEDSCGNVLTSGVVRTIYLEAKATPIFVNKLTWNPFYVTYGTVEEYRIYRLEGGNWVHINTISPNTLHYDDELEDPLQWNASVCYRVEARGRLHFPNGRISIFSSSSQLDCADLLPVIHVPTAIAPEGTNNEFKPVIIFDKEGTYRMQIFNRWGELLFESTDPQTGWDGRHKGEIVQQGVYAYYITFLGNTGLKIERKGTVMVIR